jgi:hypothetical protein
VRSLHDGGPLRPADLRGRLAATDVITAGQAFLDLLLRASLDGLIVRGPVVAGEQDGVEYAIARDHGLVAVEERAAIPPTVQDRVKGTEESRGRKPLINLGAGQVDQAGGVHHQLSAYRSPTSAPLPRRRPRRPGHARWPDRGP